MGQPMEHGNKQSGLFRKKSVVDMIASTKKGDTLRKELTSFDLTLLGIGAIIGTGVFVLTGEGAIMAGPGLIISFILAGLACAFSAFAYAEFSSTVPVTGSAYTYSYATLGEFLAWIIGWDLILEYMLSLSGVSAGWSGYFRTLLAGFGIDIPVALSSAPGGIEGTTTFFNLPAFMIVMALTVLISLGVKQSKRVNNIMVILKVLVVLAVIGVGAFYVKPDNWTPFLPEGFSGVSQAAALVFFAFLGFDSVCSAAEETRNPRKDLPRGILYSLGICTILYILINLVLMGIVPFKDFAGHTDSPVAYAMSVAGQDWFVGVVSVGAILGMTTVMLVMLYGQTRIIYAMSRDGLLPSFFSKVHEKYRTPFGSTWVVGIASALLGGFVPLGELAKLVNLGTLAAFVMISIAVVVLRKTQPELERKFRCPGVPYIPALAVIFCVYLMSQLKWETWARFLTWLGIGFVLYFVYARKHSKLNEE
ncbi:amino acid/polyamine/organocation transporter, APC superfamily [Marininema mesophilum]|uniref:Amino acid/polyamine/organocation transporter, APC superfamily n=1 Tax=Marininema mesophilum TaxID=1048340 RepID=A0A1H3CG96_9BACL|nr:amino acid permease [Marininema mesophilum]SDX53050.1 amino acid/polyamine/organocation transporter, APC superfamily [Marininema mesophilum]